MGNTFEIAVPDEQSQLFSAQLLTFQKKNVLFWSSFKNFNGESYL